jgi:hypothetical protein
MAHTPQPRAEDDAGDACRGEPSELDEFTPVEMSRHVQCTSGTEYTAPRASD